MGVKKYRASPNLAGTPVRYSGAVRADARGRRRFEGLIKFRLGHSAGRSYLVPEVLIGISGSRFFQPSMFGPPILEFNVEPGQHRLRFDFDTGTPRANELARLVVFVRSQDRVRRYDDGAQLYRCAFEGPRQITRAASGLCRATPDGDYALRLFHHTTPDNVAKIRMSGELWSSAWNLAGTRELKNVAYTYFSSLPQVANEDDLHRIAMASKGKIGFQTTSDRLREETLFLKVYRSDTGGRTAALAFDVPTALIAPPPLLLHHMVRAAPAYFEIVGPEIFRVGVRPGAALSSNSTEISVTPGDARAFDYLVLGNAATLDGLAAPYDEEDTKEITLLERLTGQDVFEFWMAHQNEDLISGRSFEAKVVAAPKPL